MVTRIPLQTGGSAWIARVFAVAFALGSGLSALLVSVLALGEDVPLAHRLLLPLVPLVFCGVSIASHAVLWRSRASDLLLDDEGLLVDGPVVDGSRRYAWTDLALTRCRLDVDPSARVKVNDHVTYQHFLRVGLAAGGEATLARSVDDDEIASFREVVALLRSRADVPEPRPLPPEVLRCDGCGAPVAPAEGPLTRCGRCGRDVSVPEALIERVRSARRRAEGHDVARRELAVVGRMPSAAVANRWLLATLVAPYVALIGACAAPFPASTWVPALFTLFQVAHLRVVERRAFNGLWVRFGAVAGEVPGSAACRGCGGPLPAPGEAALTTCPWCEATNVRGLVLRPRDAQVLAAADQDLAAFVADQRARRRSVLAGLALGIVATLAVGAGLVDRLVE